ncbi:hypothetical protein [Rahnella sp. PCH160]|uniref:hypothetical protein n=1 Tax=Rahnella sp. PCH160 TaxID=3447928 RepID=UPI0039FC675D
MKKLILILISRAIRGLGMGLGFGGFVLSIWFFFFSSLEGKYTLGIYSLIAFIIGYGLFRFAFVYIYDEKDEYY